MEGVRLLADHVMARHYPEAARAERPYRALLDAVIGAQADLIARWQMVGVHPWRDEHRQHVRGRRNDRLRALCLHGRVRPRDGLQLDRSIRAVRLLSASRASRRGT